MINGVSWKLFSPEEKTTNTKSTPQNPTKIQTQMKENPWAFWFYFLTCCLKSLFDEEWASADHPQDTTTGEAQNCPTGVHSHPAPAGLALERRILPEKDPQPALLPLPAAADWGFWSVLLLVGFFLALLLACFEYEILQAGSSTWGQPGWNSSWDWWQLAAWHWRLGASSASVPRACCPSRNTDAKQCSHSSVCLSFCRISSVRTSLKTWNFLALAHWEPWGIFEMMALGMNHSRL